MKNYQGILLADKNFVFMCTQKKAGILFKKIGEVIHPISCDLTEANVR